MDTLSAAEDAVIDAPRIGLADVEQTTSGQQLGGVDEAAAVFHHPPRDVERGASSDRKTVVGIEIDGAAGRETLIEGAPYGRHRATNIGEWRALA